jgi:subtilase family serine protease
MLLPAYRRFLTVLFVLSLLLGIVQLAYAAPVQLHGNVLPFIQSDAAQPIAGANVASDTPLILAVGLNMRDRAGLDAYVEQLHDPSSPNFHKWLTPVEIADRFGPSQADYDAVVSWLQSEQGMTVAQTFKHRLVVMARTTTGVAGSVFQVNFASFNYDNQSFVAATNDPYVPAELSGIVASIIGLDTYAVLRPNSARGAPHGQAGPNLLSPPYTPQNYWTAYKMPVLHGFDGSGNQRALGGRVNMGILTACEADTNDLNGFASQYGLTAYTLNTNYFKVAVDSTGLHLDPPTDGEATLDAEWSHAMAPGANLYFYYDNYVTGCGSGSAAWHDVGEVWTLMDAYDDNKVQTWSMSWGGTEVGWKTDAINSINTFLESMVAAGMTGFVASGDCGAYADCGSYISQNLRVDFPASDPYVVAVGGTDLDINSDGSYAIEVGLWDPLYKPCPTCVATGWGGGGGNSWLFSSKPDWQNTAYGVTGSGRGLPDVAMDMNFHYPIYYGGGIQTNWGGTSFAAPEWNGWMASFIDYALTASPSPVAGPLAGRYGQIDYDIYQIAQHMGSDGSYAFRQGHNDVTSGANGWVSGCGSDGLPDCGYRGVAGWDYATGWGSMVGDVLAYSMAWYMTTMFTHVIAGSSNGYVNVFDAGWMPLSNAKAYYYAGGPIAIAAPIDAVAMSAPSTAVVTAASGGDNGYVNIYKGPMPYGGLHPTKYYNTNAAVLSVAVSPDGSVVAAGSSNGYLNVFVWDKVALMWRVLYYNTNAAVIAVDVSHGPNNVILAGSINGYVNEFHIWWLGGPLLIHDWYYNTNSPVLCVAVSDNAPDWGGGAAGSVNGYVNYWNNAALAHTGSGKPTWYRNTNAAVNAISISAGGATMAAGSGNGYVNHWSGYLASATPDWYYNTNAPVMTVAQDPYSRWTAAGSSNGYVNLFQTSFPLPFWSRLWYYNTNSAVNSLAFSGRGTPTTGSSLEVQGFTLIVGSQNGYVNCFFVYYGKPIWYYNTNSAVNSVDASGV